MAFAEPFRQLDTAQLRLGIDLIHRVKQQVTQFDRGIPIAARLRTGEVDEVVGQSNRALCFGADSAAQHGCARVDVDYDVDGAPCFLQREHAENGGLRAAQIVRQKAEPLVMLLAATVLFGQLVQHGQPTFGAT